MKWYYSENCHVNSFSKAMAFEAKDALSAKRTAARRSHVQGYLIKLAREVDGNGFIRKPEYIRAHGKWWDCREGIPDPCFIARNYGY